MCLQRPRQACKLSDCIGEYVHSLHYKKEVGSGCIDHVKVIIGIF